MRILAVIALVVVVDHCAVVNGQTPVVTEFQKLLASDGAPVDAFGRGVAVSGYVAVVGASLNDDLGSESGSAYVFRWNGVSWVEEQKLLASDGGSGHLFGYSVSVSGDVALVGAPTAGNGAVYVFRYIDGFWVEEQMLSPSDVSISIGADLSLSDGIALVGGYDAAGSGVACVFRWDGSVWSEEQTLVASDAEDDDYWSISVAVDGNVAIVGANRDDDGGTDSGSAYLFRWDGIAWVEEQKIVASDGAANDWFGQSVALSGDLVVVGAHGDDDSGEGSGSAYMFRWDGMAWVEEQKLLASDGATSETFGFSVAASGSTAVVGAHGGGFSGTQPGSAYKFEWDGSVWTEVEKLVSSDGSALDALGNEVVISGDVILANAVADDDLGPTSGSVYVFFVPDCDEDGVDDRDQILADPSLDSNGNEILDGCETPFSRGDANGDGQFNIADPIATLTHLFGGLELDCRSAADINDDDALDLADAIFALLVQFTGGVAISPPFDCGIDPTPGPLQCLEFLACP